MLVPVCVLLDYFWNRKWTWFLRSKSSRFTIIRHHVVAWQFEHASCSCTTVQLNPWLARAEKHSEDSDRVVNFTVHWFRLSLLLNQNYSFRRSVSLRMSLRVNFIYCVMYRQVSYSQFCAWAFVAYAISRMFVTDLQTTDDKWPNGHLRFVFVVCVVFVYFSGFSADC